MIDEVAGAVVEVLDVGDVGQRITGVLDAIEALGIEALPPLAFAVDFSEMAVIGNAGEWAGFVGGVRGLEPPPVARLMYRDAEAQALLARGGGPCADYIAMRAEGRCVPGMVI